LPVVNNDDKGEFEEKPLTKISVDEAEILVKDGATLVDVRSKQEYDEKHISGAVNIQYTDIHAVAGEYLRDKNDVIIVYCSTGKRSSQAKRSLDYLGYKNVMYLGGVKL
jgi:rhodanese-related sulfurtransferase